MAGYGRIAFGRRACVFYLAIQSRISCSEDSEKKERVAGDAKPDDTARLFVEEEMIPSNGRNQMIQGENGIVVIPPRAREDERPFDLQIIEKDIPAEEKPLTGNGELSTTTLVPALESLQKPANKVSKGEEKAERGRNKALELEIKPIDTEEVELSEEIAAPARIPIPDYEPTLNLQDYKYPSLNLLETHGSDKIIQDAGELEANKNQIISTLKNYDIAIQKISATVGPTVTLYEIVPAAGVRISRIKNLEDDIALSLAALGIRIIAPIPGKGNDRYRGSECKKRRS